MFQDIKEEEITVKQLEELYKLSGSYEALFSKRAKLYKEMGLKDMNLTEKDNKLIKIIIRMNKMYLKLNFITKNGHF